ncbi:MAG: hypothetical protein AAGG38_00345 [Planctomycetota bacterium]
MPSLTWAEELQPTDTFGSADGDLYLLPGQIGLQVNSFDVHHGLGDDGDVRDRGQGKASDESIHRVLPV